MRLLILLGALLILAPHVEAFGVSPARAQVDYEETISGQITIVNTARERLDLVIAPPAEFAEYIELERSVLSIRPDEYRTEVGYTLRAPRERFDGGENHLNFRIVPLDPHIAGENAVAGAASLVSRLIVHVPLTGKNVRMRVDYDAARKRLIVPVFSIGSERIDEIRASVSIYGPTNELLATERSRTISLEPQDTGELIVDLPDLNNGNYLARITLHYDGKSTMHEQVIAYGDPILIIEDVDVPEYYFGSISKLDVHVRSEWNEPIRDIYAMVEFYESTGAFIEQVQSVHGTIDGLGTTTLPVFWDSAGYRQGSYNAKVVLHYRDQTVEQSFPVELTATGIRFGTTGQVTADEGTSWLIILVIILALINIIGWTYAWRRLRKIT